MFVGIVLCWVGLSFVFVDIFFVDFKGCGGYGVMLNVCIDVVVIVFFFVMNL